MGFRSLFGAFPPMNSPDPSLNIPEPAHPEAPMALIEPSSGTGEDLASLTPSPAAMNVPAGIALMLVGIFMFVANDVMGKWLVATYSVGQILLIRSLAGLALLLPSLLKESRATLFNPPDWRMNLIRVALTTAEVACFYWAVSYLPLADLVTVYMATPIVVTALAWPLLGERIDLARAIAVLIGFGGVVLAMRPTGATVSGPALIAIAGCLLFAFIMIVTRHLRGTKGIVLVSWQAVGALIYGVVASPFGFVMPSLRDLILLGLLGVVATLAHTAVNKALKLAPASIIMPYQYSQIVWAVLLGYLVFGDWPDATTLIGSAIIIAAGLFIFFKEHHARAKI
jgi:drug/metabolite transporter (DMT)-like permease